MKINLVDNDSFCTSFGSGVEPIRKKEGERDYRKSKPKGKDSWKEQRRKEERQKSKEISYE